MTFKHVKFEDSPIMRSLERVAKEKGLVKPEPLAKTAAAKKVNLTPTTNLLDNVLKLCAGLRERGFEKQANELEVHLVNYKRAQTLYETHKEKGENLIHDAHPEGSHKMEDVDSDEAVFEDILDQMKKSLEVVEKKPTGKLSNAEAIEAAKKAVGTSFLAGKKAGVEVLDLEPTPTLWSKLVGLFGRSSSGTIPLEGEAGAGAGEAAAAAGVGTAASAAAIALAAVVGGVIGYEIFENKFYATNLKDAGNAVLSQYNDVDAKAPQDMHVLATDFQQTLSSVLANANKAAALSQQPTPQNLQGLNDYISSLQDASNLAYKLMTKARNVDHPSNLKPGESEQEHWYSDLTTIFSGFRDVEIAAGNFINVAQKAIGDARLVLNKIMAGMQAKATAQAGGDKAQGLVSAYQQLLNRVERLQARMKFSKSPNAGALSKWLGDVVADVNQNLKDFQGEKFKDEVMAHYQANYNDTKNKLDAFEGKYGNA